jgi:hypothetical protein
VGAILTLTTKAYDAGLVNLTTMTGGPGLTIGHTGADWLHINSNVQWNDPEGRLRKLNGGRQINPELVTGVGATPTVGASPASFGHTFTRTATTDDEYDGGVAFGGTGGANITVVSTSFGSGAAVTFPLTRDLQTFWWLGWVRNATCFAYATMSDGAETVSDLALPVGAFNVYQPAWFEVTFRGNYAQVQNDETVTIEVLRTGGASANGQIHWRSSVLLTPVPAPRPKGLPPGVR